MGPEKKQGKLSCQAGVHTEQQKGLYAALDLMAPGVPGAKSICISYVKDTRVLFLASVCSSKSGLTGHSGVYGKFTS